MLGLILFASVYVLIGYVLFFSLVMVTKTRKAYKTGEHVSLHSVLFGLDSTPPDYAESQLQTLRFKRELRYMWEDFITFFYNAYMVLTFQQRKEVVYRRVVVKKVKETVEVVNVTPRSRKERTRYEADDIVTEGYIMVNGQKLKRRIVKREVTKKDGKNK